MVHDQLYGQQTFIVVNHYYNSSTNKFTGKICSEKKKM